ncbi:Zn-dependent hydrolase [Haloplanus salilacus]|uniref:Zn-dependent hydrolase n=1 Tax=Haloplanus salilacus TaxID=2949994 RepID=UPI0030D41730
MRVDIDRDRLVDTMQEQADIGGTEGGGLHRLALSDADAEARDWFVDRASDAGLEVRVDAFGNTFARRAGADPDAAPVLVGSHLDSQPYGGIYDGALGVVAGLEFVRTLNDREIETCRPVEVVNWTNEEGSRFQPAMQGSGVWAGAHDIDEEYEKTDADRTRLLDELERIGYRGDEPAEPREPYHAYLELHPEQGPYLEETGADVGIVTGIVGLRWAEVTLHGQANHTGTTPMDYREDALVAAADVVTAIRRLPGTLGERTVATVGSLNVQPDSVNIVPETVTFTTDIRDPDEAVLDTGVTRMEAEVAAAADREGVEYDIEHTMASPAVDFPDRPVEAVADAVDALDYDGRRMVSGAGHDATHTASVCDTAMVFSVSEDGKSHTEDEFTSWPDCYRSANVLANAALDLAGRVD